MLKKKPESTKSVVSFSVYLEIECQNNLAGIFFPIRRKAFLQAVTQLNPIFFPFSSACVVDCPFNTSTHVFP